MQAEDEMKDSGDTYKLLQNHGGTFVLSQACLPQLSPHIYCLRAEKNCFLIQTFRLSRGLHFPLLRVLGFTVFRVFESSAFKFYSFTVFQISVLAFSSFRFYEFRFFEFDARGAVPIYFNGADSFFS